MELENSTLSSRFIELKRVEHYIKKQGDDMKVFGIVLLLSGIIFTIYTGFADIPDATSTVSWGPWIGVLVFLTGGFFYFRARNEE